MKAKIYNYDMLLAGATGQDFKVPKGIGIEMMRYANGKLINLAELDIIYVEQTNGAFLLHAMQVPNSQAVTMQYKDRKKLYNDNGVIKLKTDDEIFNENIEQYRKSRYPDIGDQLDAILEYFDTNKNNKKDKLDEIIAKWKKVKEKFKKK